MAAAVSYIDVAGRGGLVNKRYTTASADACLPTPRRWRWQHRALLFGCGPAVWPTLHTCVAGGGAYPAYLLGVVALALLTEWTVINRYRAGDVAVD